MAIRSDFTIDWDVSPRIITIASPSVECTMQDLLDTLRSLEAQPTAMENPPITSASGKEELGGGVKVGLTVTLRNAQVAFEARPGPAWTLCNLLGGNLVSVDTDGVTTIEAIYPTAYVTISRTSSASATLQEQDALQYSSYQNGVWVDVTSGNSGTDFPSGTREYPVNNVLDAVLIAQDKGFDTLFIIGNLTLGTGVDVTGMRLVGTNPMTSILTIEAAAITTNVYIRDLYFTGTLDGGTILRDCVLGEVYYFNGYVEHCALTSNTIYLNGVGVFLNCQAGATCLSNPVLDLTDSTGLAVRNFDGSLDFVNKSTAGECEVGITGMLRIDASVTAGNFEVYGDGWVDNQGTGTSAVIDRTTGTPTEIADSVWTRSERTLTSAGAGGATAQEVWEYATRTLTESAGLTPTESALMARTAYIEAKVYVDTELLAVGDGSQVTPFNNFATAKDYAEANGIYVLVVHGEVTIPGNFKNFIVQGIGVAIIHMNGQNLHHSKFYQCTLDGVYTGTIIAQDCVLGDGLALDGFFENSMLGGDLTCIDGSVVLLAHCFSGIAGLGRPTISMNGVGSSKLSIRSYSGGLTIKDCNNALDEITTEVSQGSVTFDSSCTAGSMVARGLCKFVDETNGATVTDETSYNLISEIANLSDYNEGSWKIIANQMIYYRRDGSELMRFDLLDSAGQPISRGAMQRVKV